MSPVDFKKRPCRPVEFKGQGPYSGPLLRELSHLLPPPPPPPPPDRVTANVNVIKDNDMTLPKADDNSTITRVLVVMVTVAHAQRVPMSRCPFWR